MSRCCDAQNQRKTGSERGLSTTNEQVVANLASHPHPHASSHPLLPQSNASNNFQGATPTDPAFASQQRELPFSYFDVNKQQHPIHQHLNSLYNSAYDWLPTLSAGANSRSNVLSGSHQASPFANAYPIPSSIHSAEPPHSHRSALGTATMYHRSTPATSVPNANANRVSNRGGGSSRINRHSARHRPYTLPAHSQMPVHSDVITAAHFAHNPLPSDESQDLPPPPFDYDNPDIQRSLEKHTLTLRQVVRYGQYRVM